MVASVNHPNVVQVFSSGTDHGQFYLAMELIDCGSLEDLIDQYQRLAERQAVETGIQVVKGLHAAYAEGLIHRDVNQQTFSLAMSIPRRFATSVWQAWPGKAAKVAATFGARHITSRQSD